MADLRDDLAHVLWIGGSPHAGKTTLSRLLAGKYDLKIYNLDWHLVRKHRFRPGGTLPGWGDLSMDQRWLVPSPGELAERDISSWTARSRLVIEDLLELPRTRTIVAEGPGVFPWWTAPLLTTERQAIFLVADPRWRARAYARRNRDAPAGSSAGRTSDPARAAANIAARDALMADRIRRSCEELGLRWEAVDGSRDLDDSVVLLEEHFGNLLPATLNA